MNKITVYHGTTKNHLDNIKEKGLFDINNCGAGWYMVSSDFASALFHASPEKDDKAVVVEFELEIKETHRGLFTHTPYLWNPEVRNDNSAWFGIYKPIPPICIKKVHEIDYDIYIKQKSLGLDKSATNIIPKYPMKQKNNKQKNIP